VKKVQQWKQPSYSTSRACSAIVRGGTQIRGRGGGGCIGVIVIGVGMGKICSMVGIQLVEELGRETV